MKKRKTSNHPPAQSPVMTVPEAAQYLGVGTTTAYNLIATGQLRSFLYGPKARRITRAACDELIAKKEAEAA